MIRTMPETPAPIPEQRRAPGVPYWRLILIVNAVGALAAFGLLGGLVTHAPWSVRWTALATSFIYANCIGGLMALVMPRVGMSCRDRSRTTLWVVRLVTIPVLIVAGCAVAGVVLIAVGLCRPDQYLQYLRGSLWISSVVGTLACFTVIGYETLRGQLEATSLALRTKQLEEERARKLAIEAQLASLESRVQPHFLFNTLNSIAALIPDDPKGAERMTEQLASLLRSSLDQEPGRLIPVREELAVVRDYLEIERVRFGDRLRYEIANVPDAASVLVPRLSLQTLVENSVKFAVSPRREGASIVIRSATANGRVLLDVEDDGPGFDAAHLPSGHGLALLRDRLAMTFGDRATLGIDSVPGRTSVVIDLPRAQRPLDS